MPKLKIPTNYEGNSGIIVQYTKSREVIYVSGYYDSIVGIEGEEFDLGNFLKRIGVQRKTLKKILKEW